MNRPVRSVVLTALALVAVGGIVALAREGGHFAAGFALTALASLSSLAVGALALRRVDTASGAPSKALALPFVLKLPLLLGAGWLLLQHFPPLSVVLGAGVLVASITLHAALGTFLPSAPRKA